MSSLFMLQYFVLGFSLGDTLATGFNSFMSFMGKLFSNLFSGLAGFFQKVVDFIMKPLKWLFEFLDAIFYFFVKLFQIGVMIVKICVAAFQYLVAIGAGFFRTIQQLMTFTPSGSTHLPSSSTKGFAAVVEILQPTGIMTVVPAIATGFVLLYFTMKIIGLFGGINSNGGH